MVESEDPILFQRVSSDVIHIILNRPKVLNAMNVVMLKSLLTALKDVQSSDAAVCVLSGAGTSFCSGEDLKETLAPRSNGHDADELRTSLEDIQDITRLIAGGGVIYIASVQGWAVGGGAELALACDFVIVGPHANFSFPEIIHGHAPTGGITARLTHLVGLQQTKKLLLLGQPLTARAALDMSLVLEMNEHPLKRALELAELLSKRSRRSLASIKRSVELAAFANIEPVLQYETSAASWCFADPKSKEAFVKFQNRKLHRDEKRNPAPAADKIESSHGANIQGGTLISLLLKAARVKGGQTFLRFGSVDTSYSIFLREVAKLATAFSNLGLGSGDIIAGYMRNSAEMVIIWFAAMWTGAIWSPLHTEFRGMVLERSLKLLAPKFFIVDGDLMPYLPEQLNIPIYVHGGYNSHMTFSSLTRGIPEDTFPTISTDLSPNTTAGLLMTSGSTGPSKACNLSHSYFVSAAQALIDSLHLNADDVLFCPFPLCHADATCFTVIPALCLQSTAAISRTFSASKWWDEIRESRSTVADFMGATLSILYKAPPHISDTNNPLRIMWGVPVPQWVEEFEQRFSLQVVEVYGSTETGLPVVQSLDRPRVIGSCGVALPDILLKIADTEGHELPFGMPGELLIHQPPNTRFSGYYKNSEATVQALKNGWFYTGDICRLDSSGNLYFVGRKKHSIRRRGENVSAFEVEEALLMHPDVLECAAYGVPSDLGEDDVKVSIVMRPGTSTTELDVFTYATSTMTKFQIPRYVEFVDSLPRTSTGKVETYKLQEMWITGDHSAVRDFSTR